MRFRILGPVEAYDKGQRLALGGAKPKLLLAALLTRPGQVQPTDRLIDIIWNDDPPETARALIHTYISTLRRALNRPGADEVIVTRQPGYLVKVGPDDLDSALFERLLGQAREAVRSGQHLDAVRALRAAEALWQGPAYGGVGESALASEAARLGELRLSAIEERIWIEMELGGGDELVGELASLVGEYPTRERLRARLMVALYRLGRQADALASFHEGRDVLVDRLGIDPGPELTRVHEAILRADPALLGPATDLDGAPGSDSPLFGLPEQRIPQAERLAALTAPRASMASPPVPVPAQLPGVPADFTGRTDEIVELVSQLTAGPDEGRAPAAPATYVIAGKGGVGKSTLALRVGHEAATAFPDGQLYADLRGATDSPAQPVEVLGRFLRALGTDPATLPESLDERAARLRTLLAPRRTLIVLDDAAGEPQVRPLLPGGAGNAVLITSRRRLPGLAGAAHLDLDMLGASEAVMLLGRVAGESRVTAEATEADELVRLCGYLPLAVRIIGARLASHAHWTLGNMACRLADEGRRLDELAVADQQVRAGIHVTYESLDETAQSALRLLAIMDLPDFPAWVAANLLGSGGVDGERVVEQLVDAQVIDFAQVDALGLPRYRIHELVRIYAAERAAEQDGPAAAAAVRRVLLAWLWLIRRISDDAPTGTIPLRPDTPQAFPPDAAVAALALAQPQVWLDTEQSSLVRAVERAAALDLTDVSVALATALCGSVFAVGNHFGSWGRTHASALAAARRAGDRHAEATLLAQLGQLRCDQDSYAASHEYLLESLSIFRELGDQRGEATVLAAIGSTCREQGRLREALHFLRQAQEYFRTTDLNPALGYTGRLIGSTLLEQGDFAQAQAHLTDAVAAYRSLGCRRGEALTIRTAGLVHRALGELDTALERSLEAWEMFRFLGDDLLEAYGAQSVAKTLVRLGRGEEARGMLSNALATCRRLLDQWGEAFMLRTWGELHLAAGRLEQAEADLDEARKKWIALEVPLQRARCERDLATVREALGDHTGAAALRSSAIETCRACGAREYSELALQDL